jgi:hypothetical protein
MKEEDLKNLSVVFAIAREKVAADRLQLIEILNLEERVFEMLKNDEGESKKED